jgi:hypothetical protein
MERGTTQITEGEISTASADAGMEPLAEELNYPVPAPQSASARAREFEWSLATYFGQSFVVFAYRAPDGD